jgi:ATP-dependent helicase HrpB
MRWYHQYHHICFSVEFQTSALLQGFGLMELLVQSSRHHTKIPILSDAGNGNLAFVPGGADIEGIEDALSSTDVQQYLTRHASPMVVKRAVGCRERVDLNHFEPPEVGRQVILATTAAETSITIRDIAIVIDIGCTNLPVYDPSLRTHNLATVHVSRPQMEQGPGGASKVGPGMYIGLFETLESHKFIPTGVYRN